MNNIQWIDPKTKIWGFHVHQEVSLQEFPAALVVQQRCAEFLNAHNVIINAADAITPGYGPHLNYMWELRVEQCGEDALDQLGLALAFMAVNRYGLSAYIHPVMHDPHLSEMEALKAEGIYNQANALWFSRRVEQKQEFFFHPPLNPDNTIVDTRTSRIMSLSERESLLVSGQQILAMNPVINPYEAIVRGFHMHMDYAEDEAELALTIFDNFVKYLLDHHLRPTSTRIYAPKENGPHLLGGWEVKFETRDKYILNKIGTAIGWLMCNRQNLSVFLHPVTWEEGDHRTELQAHEECAMFLGQLPDLDLNFFKHQIAAD